MKPFKDWEKIFLDTGIILSLFNKRANPDVKNETFELVEYLIQYLLNSVSGSKKKRSFYISSITLSEILKPFHDNTSTMQRVMEAISSDITIVDFDSFTAQHITFNYFSVLGTENQKSLVKALGYPSGQFKMIREWINRDTMIIGTADCLQADVILTLDKNTFLPQALMLNVPCALVDKELFLFSKDNPTFTLFGEENKERPKFIMGYDEEGAKKKYNKIQKSIIIASSAIKDSEFE